MLGGMEGEGHRGGTASPPQRGVCTCQIYGSRHDLRGLLYASLDMLNHCSSGLFSSVFDEKSLFISSPRGFIIVLCEFKQDDIYVALRVLWRM